MTKLKKTVTKMKKNGTFEKNFQLFLLKFGQNKLYIINPKNGGNFVFYQYF